MGRDKGKGQKGRGSAREQGAEHNAQRARGCRGKRHGRMPSSLFARLPHVTGATRNRFG